MNRRELWHRGHVVTVSRRFLNKQTGRTRVRVVARKMSGEIVFNDFRDYDDMHQADGVYGKVIKQYSQPSTTGPLDVDGPWPPQQ